MASRRSRAGGNTPLPLSRSVLAALNDLIVLLYRLHGVHATVRVKGLSPDRGPWDFGRPWLCDSIRRIPGMYARCDRSEHDLCRTAARGPAAATCHAGLKQFAVPLRLGGRAAGHVLCSPVRGSAAVVPVLRRLLAAGGALGYDRDTLGYAIHQIPILSPARRRAIVRLVEAFGESLAAGGPARPGFGMFHFPVRAAGEKGWVSFLWAGFERSSDEPPDRGWIRHRAHDVIVSAAAAPAAFERPGGRRVVVDRGKLMVIPSGSRYRVAAPAVEETPPAHPFWIHYVASVDLTAIGFKPFAATLAGRPFLERLMRASARLSLFDFGSEEKLGFLEWLLQLDRIWRRPAVQRGRPPAIALSDAVGRARRYLEERIAKRVTLGELAQVSGVNVFTLCRRFRQEHGLPPLAWHRQLKIGRAIELLRGSRLPVKVIAAQVGYPDLSQFGRAVRAMTGVSPRALRAAAG